jgi:hypothetical protein
MPRGGYLAPCAEPTVVAPRGRDLVEARARLEQRFLHGHELVEGRGIRGSILQRERELGRDSVLIAEHALRVLGESIRRQLQPSTVGGRDRGTSGDRGDGRCAPEHGSCPHEL